VTVLQKLKKCFLLSNDFPAEHRIHICTTNPIESTFAALTMEFKFVFEAQKTWKKIKDYKWIPNVMKGAVVTNGERLNHRNWQHSYREEGYVEKHLIHNY